MQNVTEAVNDELVKSLDYKLGSSNVNYIQSRKDVQYFPSSLSTFTPTTSRVARIPRRREWLLLLQSQSK